VVPDEQYENLQIATKAAQWRYPLVMSSFATMSSFAYRCPSTGTRVESYDPVKTSDGAYEVVMCVMCGEVHLVNLVTGKILSQDSK
jgi:hypothetical protein